MKKTFRVLMAVVVLIIGVVLLGQSGKQERTDVALSNFSVSEDGREITLNTRLLSRTGSIRSFEETRHDGTARYLTFYSSFGGRKKFIGAKSTFVLELNESDTEIYFCRPNGEYDLVLKKNASTGQWEQR